MADKVRGDIAATAMAEQIEEGSTCKSALFKKQPESEEKNNELVVSDDIIVHSCSVLQFLFLYLETNEVSISMFQFPQEVGQEHQKTRR